MTEDYTQLKEKLARFAGFKRVYPIGDIWVRREYRDYGLPDFPNDLNACFKWLVPKLVEVKLEFNCRSSPSCFDKFHAYVLNGRWSSIGDANTAALALCLAIEKLIDKE